MEDTVIRLQQTVRELREEAAEREARYGVLSAAHATAMSHSADLQKTADYWWKRASDVETKLAKSESENAKWRSGVYERPEVGALREALAAARAEVQTQATVEKAMAALHKVELEGVKEWMFACRAAEADRDRLREALEAANAWIRSGHQQHALDAIRAALSKGAP